MPLWTQPAEFLVHRKWCKKAEEQQEFACFWVRGLVAKTWTAQQVCQGDLCF